MRKIPQETSISLDIKIPEAPLKYDLDLSNNQINPSNFPFSIWAKLSRETMSERSKELMEVSPTGGAYELRAAIADYLKSFRRMLVDPNQIVIGAGTEYLYGLLIQILGNDKKYCIENPGYKKLTQIYKQHNIECRYADIDENGIAVSSLNQSGADIAHISPNHHFPMGITMPANRRYEVLAWANEKSGRYIIEDDYDSEFRLNGRPLPTLFSIDACEKVIYMNTFSKSLTPTIRISYMILPVHLANKFYSQLSFYSCTVSNFEQYTLAAFINKGYLEKHINRMRLYYSRQRKRLIDYIENSKLREKCEIIENESGLHFLLRLKTDVPDDEIKERLSKKGIKIQSLSEYYLTPKNAKEHYFIINYSNIDLNRISEILENGLM
jgi:GntR family transcriptional regulator/MocR family aminotransferase